MTSVSSATSALAALQALSLRTSSNTQTPASEASTGVGTTPTTGVAAQSSLFALGDGASQALSTADAAVSAGQTVLGLLQQMRQSAGQAADPASTADQRAGLDHAFRAAAGQIAPVLAAAAVNGTNLVDGSSKTGLKVALGGGATASLAPVDLTLMGPVLGLPADGSVATTTGASSSYLALGGAIVAAGGALSTLKGQADQIDAHLGFVQQLGQALATPSDDGGDSARLLALQVSQQLAGQTAPIANGSSQSLLSLFAG